MHLPTPYLVIPKYNEAIAEYETHIGLAGDNTGDH